MFINNTGHMTKMAYMPIYGKTPSKIFFYGTGVPISRKCDLSTTMGFKNHDPVMTLTNFTARST